MVLMMSTTSITKRAQLEIIGYLLGTAALVERQNQPTHKTIDWRYVYIIG